MYAEIDNLTIGSQPSEPPKSVPEPNSPIELLALGVFGTVVSLKRKQKQIEFTRVETRN